jgi:hypothetical protein
MQLGSKKCGCISWDKNALLVIAWTGSPAGKGTYLPMIVG